MSATLFRSPALASVTALLLCTSVRAQETPPPAAIDLIVDGGRPLRVALDERVNVKRVGQPITGTLVDALYAYDRVVVPAGTVVRGHVERLDNPPTLARVQSLAAGDFSPNHRVVVDFDTLILAGGRELPIRTVVTSAAEHITFNVSAAAKSEGSEDTGSAGITGRARETVLQAKHEATQKARDALAAIKSPGKIERAKTALISRLPYHPQYLSKGTVYVADLLVPLDFGAVTPSEIAPSGSRPAPESILNARLVTPLDSAKTARGTPIEAIVTEPVFSADHQLVLPEGARLIGEVTFATQARRFHRSGQLRFLFESVQPPKEDAGPLLASLYSVQVADTSAVDVDEEGGMRARDSNTRFIAPVLAVLALRASTHRERRRADNDADDSLAPPAAGNPGSRGVGGFFGWGLAGAALGQVWRPVGVALAAVGAARTLYGSVFAKGREVTFPGGTVIQIQLAPGPASRE
jgi:hypothetical protein